MMKLFRGLFKQEEETMEEVFEDILQSSIKSISEAGYVKRVCIGGMDNFGEVNQEFLDYVKEKYDGKIVQGQTLKYLGLTEGGIEFTW